MSQHFVNILKEVSQGIQIELNEIRMLSKAEENELLVEFNNTELKYIKEKTIQELFEEQVEKTPENVAVVFEEKHLTYRELNNRANQLARLLREKGVEPNTIVGIIVERSVEMLIGIMGILKAGGAYLPIDPNYPDKRKEFIFSDSDIDIVLAQEHLLNKDKDLFQKLSLKDVIVIDDEKVYSGNIFNLNIVNKEEDLAYIIYTSGTTGNPKGVMIEHRNVNNLVCGLREKIYRDLNDDLRVS
ncbi:AMP-binding protein, partial [Abyssisolibacter fermentans]|uniref:AMP-binding protein n=1 Tax=Abyssisolibacter fermentans TaxID=1766203 RepID=UPI00138F9804